MPATLFGVPSSHPTLAAELMLRHRGIGYRRIDLVSGLHRGMVRALVYPRNDGAGAAPGRRAPAGDATSSSPKA